MIQRLSKDENRIVSEEEYVKSGDRRRYGGVGSQTMKSAHSLSLENTLSCKVNNEEGEAYYL